MKARIIYKIYLLTYKALKFGEPKYINEYLVPFGLETSVAVRHANDRHRLFEPRTVRSSAKEWGNRVVGCRREVVKVEELKKPEKKQEYQDKLKEAYDRGKEREAGELEEEWRLMKESLVGYASDVCGKRFVGGCMRRGSEWWNEEVKMKAEEKKRAF